MINERTKVLPLIVGFLSSSAHQQRSRRACPELVEGTCGCLAVCLALGLCRCFCPLFCLSSCKDLLLLPPPPRRVPHSWQPHRHEWAFARKREPFSHSSPQTAKKRCQPPNPPKDAATPTAPTTSIQKITGRLVSPKPIQLNQGNMKQARPQTELHKLLNPRLA